MTTVRTFAQDVLALSSLNYSALHPFTPIDTSAYAIMCEGLACIVRGSRDFTVCEISIERLPLDRQGYAPSGRYFGRGLAVFRVWVDGDLYTLRAESRKTLRAALKRLYPMASVGR